MKLNRLLLAVVAARVTQMAVATTLDLRTASSNSVAVFVGGYRT